MICPLILLCFLTIESEAFVSAIVRKAGFHPSSSLSQSQTTDYSIADSFNLVVLGDLHMEDDMSHHEQARSDCIKAIKDLSLLTSSIHEENANGHSMDKAKDKHVTVNDIISRVQSLPAGDLSENELEILLEQKRNGSAMKSYMVSLGDLGRKDIRKEQGDAGTTKSFVDAKAFFDGFGLPYDLVTGNHDLEGLYEFDTDEENLKKWMTCFEKSEPYFSRQIGEKTLLIGMSTVRFRDSPHSSHECHVDDSQLEWFQRVVEEHPHEDGWKICVFTHAPIMGSNLRVLQNVHVINGCAWMNHCSSNRSTFIETVKQHPQVKLWFSGHFHLSHDYEDALSKVNQCTFVQAGVMGPLSSRDKRRQTRIVQGNEHVLKMYTVNHHKRDAETGVADLRLDAQIDIKKGTMTFEHKNEDFDNENWFRAYTPEEEDGCYVSNPSGKIDVTCEETRMGCKVCWWHMADGAVIGLHEGQLVEYDEPTLSPLGIVVNKKELRDREVLIVDDSKVIVLVDQETSEMEVIHPNDDGSYWRKYQRNKRIRLEEKAREAAAKLWMDRKGKV